MKRILSVTIMAVFTMMMYAQKDITTFLGIPIDGFKSEMKQKLIAKGFTPQKNGTDEFYKGEFNGTDVHVFIATNNNKVYRIMVCDANTRNEADIKTRFNRLVSQFENNKRYTSFDKFTISDDVDISYEMGIKNKNFDALFYQVPDMAKLDTLAMQEKVTKELLSKYTEEQLQKPTEEINKEATSIAMKNAVDLFIKKPVWFRICKMNYDEYYITMFYDNEYNHANGEDL